MLKENEAYQKDNMDEIEKLTPSLEQLKCHLTCAAEISEEVGLFHKTAEIKQVNSDICRMQDKEDDATKLDYSISELKKKEQSKNKFI